jgi:DNA-binding SARP family transcriptional activator
LANRVFLPWAAGPVKLRTRKQLALLCYLAMEQRLHTRDALAELLWPRVPQNEARHSLSTAISGLRGKLGKEVFESSGDRFRLRPGAIALDVDRLLRGEVLATEFEDALDVDGFLQSFDLTDAIPFSHWRDGEHARLLPNVRDALVILIDHCRRTGDFRQIETLALRLLRFDSLSEEGIRARMEARAFAGDRLTALRLFKEWKAALSRKLGAVPSPLLEGMALRLRRREWERPESPDIPAVRTDQWRGRPFVGRGREYRELYEAWEGTQRGAARHRLLLGDSGIGKSTLVERLTTAAGLEGATVARVQCHEVEREIPYAMVSGLIAQLVERPGSSGTPPDALAELGQTIPAVRQRFPVLPPPLESQGDAARIRFTEAAHALMAAVAEEHPVILVVDDVHHADDVSLAVLHRIVRLADTQRILMLFVARPR